MYTGTAEIINGRLKICMAGTQILYYQQKQKKFSLPLK